MDKKKEIQPNQELVLDPWVLSIKPRELYAVYILNDDYTPMDFVVEVLIRFFSMSQEVATEIMLQVHQNGRAICGQYSRDIAETKVVQVNEYARRNQHPLLCGMEEQ